MIVTVRSAGLIAAEKARQTLDVLLTTPLPLSAVAGQKLRGLWRVMAIVSVPILIQAAFVGYFHISASGPHASYYGQQGFNPSQSAELHFLVVALNLIVLLSLAAQLAFLFGLKAQTQGRAVTATLGVFAAWSVIPLFIRLFATKEHGPVSESDQRYRAERIAPDRRQIWTAFPGRKTGPSASTP